MGAGKCKERLLEQYCSKATARLERLGAQKAKVDAAVAQCPTTAAAGAAADPKAVLKCKWLKKSSEWIAKATERISKGVSEKCPKSGTATGTLVEAFADEWEEAAAAEPALCECKDWARKIGRWTRR